MSSSGNRRKKGTNSNSNASPSINSGKEEFARSNDSKPSSKGNTKPEKANNNPKKEIVKDSPQINTKETQPPPKDEVTSSPPPSSVPQLSAVNNNLMFERTLWVITNLIGKHVETQVKTGEVYEGILHTVNTDRGMSVVLRMARKKPLSSKQDDVVTSRPTDTLVIQSADLLQIFAKDVSFDLNRSEKEFVTDTEISGTFSNRERILQPWVPDEGEDEKNTSLDFNQKFTNWDQFEINARLFGVTSTYQEEIYTTPLDKTSDEYKRRLTKAELIAQEIECATDINPHVLEERGKDDSGLLDEEDRYGAVLKDTLPGGKYLPPAKRPGFLTKSLDNSKQPSPSSTPKMLAIKEEKLPPTKKPEPSKKPTKDLTDFSLDAKSTKPTPEVSKDKPTSPPSEINSNNLARLPSKEDIKNNPLARTGSTEILKMPPSPKMKDYNERLRIARTVHADKLKPSISPLKSPLQSPLIGNPNLINSLSLQPSSPSVSPAVVQSFVNSIHDKKKADLLHNRSQFTSSLKAFSKECVIPKTKPTSEDDESLIEKTSKISSSQESEKTTTNEATPVSSEVSKEVSKEASKETPKESSTTTQTPSASNATLPTTNPAPASTEQPSSGSDIKKKLNPNAKEFKPMSASAPVFTPKLNIAPIPVAPLPIEPILYPGFIPEPYGYQGYAPPPVYLFPYQGYPPPPQPMNPPFFRPPFPQTGPPMGKRGGFQPKPLGSDGSSPAFAQPFVPSSDQGSGREEKGNPPSFQPRSQSKSKFTPVPNTDSLPSTNNESSKTS